MVMFQPIVQLSFFLTEMSVLKEDLQNQFHYKRNTGGTLTWIPVLQQFRTYYFDNRTLGWTHSVLFCSGNNVNYLIFELPERELPLMRT
jgi:hypothetical protein